MAADLLAQERAGMRRLNRRMLGHWTFEQAIRDELCG
jgi:hypothetical protein